MRGLRQACLSVAGHTASGITVSSFLVHATSTLANYQQQERVCSKPLWSEVGGQHHHEVCSHVPARPRFADAPGLDRNNWTCGGQGQGSMGPPGATPAAQGGPGGLLNGARGRRGRGEDFCAAPRTRRGGTGCDGLSWDLVFQALSGATGGGSDAPTTQWDGGNRQVPPGKPPRRRTDSP